MHSSCDLEIFYLFAFPQKSEPRMCSNVVQMMINISSSSSAAGPLRSALLQYSAIVANCSSKYFVFFFDTSMASAGSCLVSLCLNKQEVTIKVDAVHVSAGEYCQCQNTCTSSAPTLSEATLIVSPPEHRCQCRGGHVCCGDIAVNAGPGMDGVPAQISTHCQQRIDGWEK